MLELEHQLHEKEVTLEVAPDAVQWLAENGYDELMGARPMARLIQEHIKKPLAEELRDDEKILLLLEFICTDCLEFFI